MRKSLAVLLALALVLSVTACGKKMADSSDNTTTESSSSTSDTSSTETTEETTGESTEETTEESTEETTEETTEASSEPTDDTGEAARPDTPAAPHSHDYRGELTTQPGCEKDGVKTYTCACGDAYTEVVRALGHSWGDWVTVKEPTTAEAGTAKRTCSACGGAESKTLSKLPSAEPEQLTISDEVLGRIKTEFLRLVNAERSRLSLGTLTLNEKLDSAASIRGDEIVTLFSHTRPNGEPYYTAVDAGGYSYRMVGENICMTSHVGSGSYTAADKWVGSQSQIEAAATWTFVLFKNSPGHYENMITPDYTECGIGITCKIEDGVPFFYTAHLFGTR